MKARKDGAIDSFLRPAYRDKPARRRYAELEVGETFADALDNKYFRIGTPGTHMRRFDTIFGDLSDRLWACVGNAEEAYGPFRLKPYFVTVAIVGALVAVKSVSRRRRQKEVGASRPPCAPAS